MHAQVMYDLAKLKIEEDRRIAARSRLAAQARQGREFQGRTGESLLERVAEMLRRAATPTGRAASGAA